MKLVLKIVSVLIFSLSFGIHVATYLPGVSLKIEHTFPMHIAVMAIGIIMYINVRSELNKIAYYSFNCIGAEKNKGIDLLKYFKDHSSKRAYNICRYLFLYVFLNFFVFMILMREGYPEEINGNYYLYQGSSPVRQLTEQEYSKYSTYEVRGFSGHWLFFSFLPVAFYFTRKNKR